MKGRRWSRLAPLLALFFGLASFDSAHGMLFTSKAAYTGDWANANTWTNNSGWPNDGDDVEITNAGSVVILSGTSSNLSSVTNCATLMFTNWNSALQATNVVILGGAFTLPPAFASGAQSNNVYVVCTNIFIASSGSITADGRGYAGQYAATGYGPGGGSSYGGGGYGGSGGRGDGGATYGSPDAPTDPGSAGGGSSAGSYAGSSGGGAVRIQASGTVTVNGSITANGNGGGGLVMGAGSGGGIYVTCGSITGTDGIVRANGGWGGSGSTASAGGGGGRIAVIYGAAQGSIPIPSILFQTYGGGSPNGTAGSAYGNVGTLYFPDNRFLTETFPHAGLWSVPAFTSWAPTNLLMSNSWLKLPAEGFQLRITNGVSIMGTNNYLCRLELANGLVTCGGDAFVSNAVLTFSGYTTPGSSFSVGGSLTLTNGSAMYLYSGPTNMASTQDYGALMDVTKDVRITANSFIYLYSNPTNGGSPILRLRNLTIDAGGGINANGSGYADQCGPSIAVSGIPGVGAGYGGFGGKAAGANGQTYGSSNAPIDPGSGGSIGSSYYGGRGGGAVRVRASGTVTVNGTITANAGAGSFRSSASGGGIYIVCRTFSGSGGTLSANGGTPSSTGYASGGGGRIAVWRSSDSFSGTVSVTNGNASAANNGQTGTVVWVTVPFPGTVLSLR